MTFQKCEEEGRDLFRELCQRWGWSVLFSDDQYDPADAEAGPMGGDRYLVEIKVRRISKDQYDSALLEEKKRRALLKEVEEWGLSGAFYVSFYEEGYVRVWDVAKTNHVDVEVRSCPDTTCATKKYVKKDVRMLPHGEAVSAGKL